MELKVSVSRLTLFITLNGGKYRNVYSFWVWGLGLWVRGLGFGFNVT